MTEKFDLQPVVKAAKVAAKRTADGLRQSMGLATDPDVRLYYRLKPDDFHEMRRLYGDHDIWNYVQEMEHRRLGRKAPERVQASEPVALPPPMPLGPEQREFPWMEDRYTAEANDQAAGTKLFIPSK